jgi:hypothetical protein
LGLWIPGLRQEAHPGMTKVLVNAIFTTFMRVRFTKAFDVIARHCSRTCVWRACIGD